MSLMQAASRSASNLRQLCLRPLCTLKRWQSIDDRDMLRAEAVLGGVSQLSSAQLSSRTAG